METKEKDPVTGQETPETATQTTENIEAAESKKEAAETAETTENRSAFSAEVNAAARRLTELAKEDGEHRAFILLSTETTPKEEQENEHLCIVAARGSGFQLIRCLHSFFEEKNHRSMGEAALFVNKLREL